MHANAKCGTHVVWAYFRGMVCAHKTAHDSRITNIIRPGVHQSYLGFRSSPIHIGSGDPRVRTRPITRLTRVAATHKVVMTKPASSLPVLPPITIKRDNLLDKYCKQWFEAWRKCYYREKDVKRKLAVKGPESVIDVPPAKCHQRPWPFRISTPVYPGRVQGPGTRPWLWRRPRQKALAQSYGKKYSKV